jgi:hypothetical protein
MRTDYYDFVEDNLRRIKKGMYFDLSLTPYDSDFVDRMIQFYESEEEYEKCKYLLEFKNKRFNHKFGYKNIA